MDRASVLTHCRNQPHVVRRADPGEVAGYASHRHVEVSAEMRFAATDDLLDLAIVTPRAYCRRDAQFQAPIRGVVSGGCNSGRAFGRSDSLRAFGGGASVLSTARRPAEDRGEVDTKACRAHRSLPPGEPINALDHMVVERA